MDSLNDLIGSAQSLLKHGFDIETYRKWKCLAFLVLLGQLGPFHYYTRNFTRLTSEANKRGLLAGKGVLSAAKEEISTGSRHKDLNKRSFSLRKRAAHAKGAVHGKKWYSLHAVQRAHHC